MDESVESRIAPSSQLAKNPFLTPPKSFESDTCKESFRKFADTLFPITFILTAEGKNEFCNRAWYQFTGLDPLLFSENQWSEPIHPDDLNSLLRAGEQMKKSNCTVQTEFRLRRHDGVYQWHFCQVQPYFDPKGDLLCWIGTSLNIHPQKETTEKALQAQREVEEILESTEDAFLSVDSELRITRVNQRQEFFSRQKKEAVLGKTLWEVFPDAKNLFPKLVEGMELANSKKTVFTIEEYYAPSDLWVEVRAYPREGRELFIFLRDVTLRKKNETRFKAALDSAKIGSWEWNFLTHKFWRSINHDFLYGFDQNEKNWNWDRMLSSICAEDREKIATTFQQALLEKNEFEYEFRVLWPNGTLHWLYSRGRIARDPLGNPVSALGSTMDITELKQVEDDLTLSRNRYDMVLQSVDLGVWYCDLPGNDFTWNQKVREHFWLPPDAPVSFEVFYALLHPDDRERTREAINRSIEQKTRYDVEYRTVNPENGPENGKMKWIRAIGQTFCDLEGTPYRFDGITIDVTERHLIEQKLNEVIKARDEFLSIASHELKTPLTSLQLQLQLHKKSLLRKDPKALEASQIEKTILASEQQIQRITQLTDDMLDISRVASKRLILHFESFELISLIRDIILRLGSQIESSGSLFEFEFEEKVWGTWDKLRIDQVITNLVTNALKYGKKRPIKLTVKTIGEEGVQISVQDQGIGVAKEDQERIFQRFERAISPHSISGLGLGLYIVKKIVQMHNGVIELESEKEKGSTFSIKIPLQPSPIFPS